MATEIESILLEESVYPTIKLEALESDQIESNEEPYPIDEIKFGEIFRISKDHLKFVCIHCFGEFSHLNDFTIHIEGHLQEIQLNGFNENSDTVSDIVDVKPFILDCNADIFVENGSCDGNYVRPAKKKSKNRKPKWKCPNCDRYFEQQCLLKRHYDVAHEKITFCCQICQKTSKHKQNIKRHMKTLHPNDDENAYTAISKKGIDDPSELKRIAKREAQKIKKQSKNRKSKWKCPDCDRYFEQQCLLKRHYDVAHEKITFCCQICQKTSKHKQNIKRHMKTLHPNDDENAYTTISKKGIDDPTELRRIAKREARKMGKIKNKHPIECPDCGELYKNQSSLARHYDRYHRQLTYLCSICNSTTAHKQNIIRHLRARHAGDDENSYTIIANEINVEAIPTKIVRRQRRTKNVSEETGAQFCVEKKIPIDGPTSTDGADYLSDSPLQQNKSEDNEPKPLKCPDCDRYFNQPCMLRRHYEAHHDRVIYLCNNCKISIKHKHNMMRHMRTMHPNDDENSYTIISNADQGETNDSATVPPSHSETYTQPKPLSKKIKIKRNESGEFECKDCPKTYMHLCLLKRHWETVHTNTVFKCKICHQTVNYKANMYRHMKSKHPNHLNAFTKVKRMASTAPINIIPTQFECYLCRISFDSFKEVAKHFRKIHLLHTSYYYNTKFRLRTCNKCGEQFNGISMFEKHKRWHKSQLNYRPHKCDLCTMAFIEQHQLKRHLQRHMAVKDSTCKICNKSMSHIYMKEHLRRHTDQRRVQCTVCGNFYSDTGKLSRHMRTHTGELPYKCEYCGKRFTQSSSYAVHKRSHTGEYIHYCKPCEKGFGARRELKKHNLRVHGMEVDEENKPK